MQQLHTECSIPYAQMNCVRVSVLIARQHPETLDMGVKKIEKEAPKSITFEEAKREAAKQSDGLDDF